MYKKLNLLIVCLLIFHCAKEKLTPDQKAVKEVLIRYTEALKKGDFAKAYEFLSENSKKYITLVEFNNTWIENASTFEIKKFSVGTISIIKVNDILYATAIVKREEITNNKKVYTNLTYNLQKEQKGWRILRTNEISDKAFLLWKAQKYKEAEKLINICLKIDPLLASSREEFVEKYFVPYLQSYYTYTPQPQEPEIKIKNPVIGVKVLKVEDEDIANKPVLVANIEITNYSDKFIEYCDITCCVYNEKGEYLGRYLEILTNLRPGKSLIEKLWFYNVRSWEVKSWKFVLGNVDIEEGGKRVDATKYFTLKTEK